jgi:pimeloyl-ACP methyl ester carboxylesterase
VPVFDANGIPLYYEEEGIGEPVVLVHGTLCDHTVWKAQAEPFSAKYRTIAYSRRYAHPNNRQGDLLDSTVQNNAEDLLAFIDGLGLGKVHVVGHSYGGFIAAFFALKHPDKVGSLTLANAAVAPMLVSKQSAAASLSLLLRSPSVAISARNLINATKATVKAVDGGDATAAFRIFVPALSNNRTDLPPKPPSFEPMVTRNARTLRETTAPFPPVTKSEVGGIKVPTLVIWGALSAPWDYKVSQLLAQAIPGAEAVVVPNTGHFFFLENVALANEKMLEFLEAPKRR